jgi:undecaprenyl diphosphate synthase
MTFNLFKIKVLSFMSTLATPSMLDALKTAIASGKLRHVAFIMDGNRRWAKQNRMSTAEGHLQGYAALKEIVRHCQSDLQLPAMTVYAFSTENWKRPAPEIDFLMSLFSEAIDRERDELVSKNIQVRYLGDLGIFAPSIQKACEKTRLATEGNTGMIYQVAINYGSRSEMVRAVKALAQQVQAGTLGIEDITEAHLNTELYTHTVPDPDIIIRTGGENRLSNFMLWQAAYAELSIVEPLWPEFSPEQLDALLYAFLQRDRRFGQ